MYACVYVCTCVYVYIYTYTHVHTYMYMCPPSTTLLGSRAAELSRDARTLVSKLCAPLCINVYIRLLL